MPIVRMVHIVIEESIQDGTAKVLVQFGAEDPIDTGIRANTVADAAKMVADRIGGRA